MNRTNRAILAAAIILMTVSGCGKAGTSAVSIDGHVFNVPRDHLIEGTIPWLPRSQRDALIFVMNPDAPVSARKFVLLESTAITCHPKTAPTPDELESACKAAEQAIEAEGMGSSFELDKVRSNFGDAWWTYRLKRTGQREERGATVASCSAMADGNGLCQSLSNYRDLIYNVGLRDNEIELLPEIHEQVRALLSSWEAPRR